MPVINVKPETYAALERIAAEQGQPIEATVEIAVGQFLCNRELPEEEYQRAWDSLLAQIRAGVPIDTSPEQIERDIDTTTDEIRAERRARNN